MSPPNHEKALLLNNSLPYGSIAPSAALPPPPLPKSISANPEIVLGNLTFDDEDDECKDHNDITDYKLEIASNSSDSSSSCTPVRKQPHMQSILPRELYRSPSILIKTQSTFWGDARTFAPGSIPHSIVLALTIGVVCGVAAYLYYSILEISLDFLWHTLPEKYVIGHWDPRHYWLWIPIVGFGMAFGVGLTVKFMGDPGDLPYTIDCVHKKAYVAMSHVMPMVCASQCSILAGGSLGPEAPLVAICAALGGAISRKVFRIRERNLIRKHTLMGMAGALAAFFGCPLGGSLFALEVNSRFGVEYFEHTMEAIFCGEVCLAVFRTLAGLPIASIWNLTDQPIGVATPRDLLAGASLGLVGAAVAWGFASFHGNVMRAFEHYNLLDDRNAVLRAMAGATIVVLLGVLIPQTMFWGEFEIQTIATLGPASGLKHIWPTAGLLGFEMNSFGTSLLVGVTKLVAISFTVAGGYRGGYIFPAFASAAALGRAIHFLYPSIPVQLCVLCMAAAVNVALTRTTIATTLILSFLSNEQASISPVLAAALVSLFSTGYMPFIKSQAVRNDIDSSIYHSVIGSSDEDDCDDADTSNLHTNHYGETIIVAPGSTPMSDMRKTPYQEYRKTVSYHADV